MWAGEPLQEARVRVTVVVFAQTKKAFPTVSPGRRESPLCVPSGVGTHLTARSSLGHGRRMGS